MPIEKLRIPKSAFNMACRKPLADGEEEEFVEAEITIIRGGTPIATKFGEPRPKADPPRTAFMAERDRARAELARQSASDPK